MNRIFYSLTPGKKKSHIWQRRTTHEACCLASIMSVRDNLQEEAEIIVSYHPETRGLGILDVLEKNNVTLLPYVMLGFGCADSYFALSQAHKYIPMLKYENEDGKVLFMDSDTIALGDIGRVFDFINDDELGFAYEGLGPDMKQKDYRNYIEENCEYKVLFPEILAGSYPSTGVFCLGNAVKKEFTRRTICLFLRNFYVGAKKISVAAIDQLPFWLAVIESKRAGITVKTLGPEFNYTVPIARMHPGLTEAVIVHNSRGGIAPAGITKAIFYLEKAEKLLKANKRQWL